MVNFDLPNLPSAMAKSPPAADKLMMARMVRTITSVCALLALGWGTARSQFEVSRDTLKVIESSTTVYQGQTVDYFLLSLNTGAFIFIEDSAYVKLLGFLDGGDTAWLPEATVWMKTSGAQVGDSWPGMLPFDQVLFTQEEIVGTKMVTVGAGTFPVFAVGVWDNDGQYLGEKWYNNGAGLIGWNIHICNLTDELQVLEYDASGTGFWPHALGDTWVYDSRTNRTSVSAPTAVIAVDGSKVDWGGVTPAVTDSAGDDMSTWPGSDINELLVAVRNDTLYLGVTFWDGEPDSGFASGNPFAYSFIFEDNGIGDVWGYSVAYEPDPVSQWRVEGHNLSVAGTRAEVAEMVEMAVPLSNLGTYQSEIPFFSFAVDSGYADVSCHTRVVLPVSCPIAKTGDVQADGNLTAADIVYLVNFVLKAGASPLPCSAAGDVNCNGTVSTSDIVYMVNRVFKAGPEPCDVCAHIPGLWTCP